MRNVLFQSGIAVLLKLQALLIFTLLVKGLPAYSQNAQCVLKVADLEAIIADNSRRIRGWRLKLMDIDSDWDGVRKSVLETVGKPGGCNDSIFSDIERLRQKVESAEVHRGVSGRLTDWIESTRSEAFLCLADIEDRLQDAITSAVTARKSLRVQKLSAISDRLTIIGTELTDLFAAAEAARAKSRKLLEDFDRLEELCQEPEF